MRWNRLARALILITLVSLAMQVVMAAEEPAELKGKVVKIQDIIQNEPAYNGNYTVIAGKIQDECGSGCWFTVDDGTGQIYVNIKPNNFVIPQKRGSDVKVYGKVTTQNGDPAIIGKMVEIDGTIYQYKKS